MNLWRQSLTGQGVSAFFGLGPMAELRKNQGSRPSILNDSHDFVNPGGENRETKLLNYI
jgi:hypothetical protein